MQFTLTINCDNAAFEPHPGDEVARILAVAAEHANQGVDTWTLRDINGNTVGSFAYTEK